MLVKYDSNRILESLTGKSIIEFFVSNIPADREVCIVCYGKIGHDVHRVMKRTGRHKIICVCDNAWQGIVAMELEDGVISVENACKNYPNAVFVVTSFKDYIDIEIQLNRCGIRDEMIYSFTPAVICNYRLLVDYNARLDILAAEYYDEMAVYPDLINPRTYNEKMMCAMTDDAIAMQWSRYVDKLAVRKYVMNQIGSEYLIPLIGQWKRAEDIDFDSLPSQFVLKTTHGSGSNIIYDGKGVFDRQKSSKKLKHWLDIDFSGYKYEMQYHYIEPFILCEEYIENKGGNLYDYKVFCFHGEPQYIMFLADRKNKLKMSFYDTAWNKMPFVYTFPRYEEIVAPPKSLKMMLELSKRIAMNFEQVRVDWYVLDDGTLKFGEMTFTSDGGRAIWNPWEWDLKLGELI